MQKSFNIFAAVTVTALALSLAVDPAKAALISWQTAQTISSDTDVDTTGSLYASANFASASNRTVNGVVFTAFPITNGGTSATVGNIGLTGVSNIVGALPNLQGGSLAATPGAAANPYASLSTNYKNLLTDIAYFVTGNPDGGPTLTTMNFTLSGLTSGTQYLIQYWVSNPDASAAHRLTQVGYGATGPQFVDPNVTNSSGGLGQWIKGTFTADATQQSFSVAANNSGGTVNQFQNNIAYATAMQVRIVPEPTQMVFVAGVGAALGAWRLRKLRRNGRGSNTTAR